MFEVIAIINHNEVNQKKNAYKCLGFRKRSMNFIEYLFDVSLNTNNVKDIIIAKIVAKL
jgi:hypothetical protein